MTDSVVPPSTTIAQVEAKRILNMFLASQKPVQLSASSHTDKFVLLANWLCNTSGRLACSTCDIRKALTELIRALQDQLRVGRTSTGQWRFVPVASIELAR